MSRLCHWEIPSTDVGGSAKFYADLFGWRMQAFDATYTMFDVADGVGGGIQHVDSVPDPCIQVYVSVDDIPAALARVEELGGHSVMPKTEIGGGMGFMAFFTDPCGCQIGLWSEK